MENRVPFVLPDNDLRAGLIVLIAKKMVFLDYRLRTTRPMTATRPIIAISASNPG